MKKIRELEMKTALAVAEEKGWITENTKKMHETEFYYYVLGRLECERNGWTMEEYIFDTFLKMNSKEVLDVDYYGLNGGK